MKSPIILLFLILVYSPVFSQSTRLEEAKQCFDSGNYSCAIDKFSEAIKLLEGKEKQIAEINLGRAKTCAEWLKVANQAFSTGNYKTARENYQYILDENPKDTYALKQIERCNEKQNSTVLPTLRKATAQEIKDIWNNKYGSYPGRNQNLINAGIDPVDAQNRINSGEGRPQAQIKEETKLGVSKEVISFTSKGGSSERIIVYTNSDSYTVSFVPSWCTVQTYIGYFIVTCTPLTSIQSRTDWFRVTAGNKDIRVSIIQSGIDRRTESTLSLSNENVYFSAYGGQSEQIIVNTNQDKYSISLVPSWCTVQTYNGYFTITCTPNNSSINRTDWFRVSAGGKEISVYVTQVGNSNKNTTNNIKSSERGNVNNKNYNCFNCPKNRDFWGLTGGYSQLASVNNRFFNGVQFGFRFEPLFKYGFGLNTGLLLGTYFDNSTSYLNSNSGFRINQYAFNIPLHIQYRLNILESFSLFAYGGPGFNFNIVTTSSKSDYYFPTTFEYGGGFRAGHIQINIGQSLYVGNLKNIQDFGKNTGRYQNIVASLSYLF